MKLSVIIPAHNEEETLPSLLSDLRRVLSSQPYESEVIVVDDHSQDRTREVTTANGALSISNQRRNGKGNALIAGFEKARGEYLLMMDADGSHLPEYVPEFVRLLDQGYGLVIGSRQLGGSDEYTFLRALGNIFLSGVFNLITASRITDVLNGYKGFKQDVFQKFSYRSAEFEIEIELVGNALKAGYRIGEFACHEKARAGGEAKSRVVRHGTRFLFKILQITIPFRLAQLFKPRP